MKFADPSVSTKNSLCVKSNLIIFTIVYSVRPFWISFRERGLKMNPALDESRMFFYRVRFCMGCAHSDDVSFTSADVR